MKIADLLNQKTMEKAGVIVVKQADIGPITSLAYDSRDVKTGSLFFALPGLHTDGHNFISDALKKGAAAVVHQFELSDYRDNIFYIRVKDSRFAMSPIADAFFGHPSQKMFIIGVTGTEGKSTTVYLIYQLLKLLGKKAGFVSTVQYGDGITEKWNAEHQTTPEAVILHRLLDEMYKNGAEYAVLESSSHGLSKKTNRLGDVAFDVGVMTNVNHEHLEFHGSWEQYRSDKAELFRALDNSSNEKSFGVANADDPSAVYFAEVTKQKTYFYSVTGAEADLCLKSIKSITAGNSYEVYDKSSGKIIAINDQLPGAFNADNTLAALSVVSNLFNINVQDLVHLVLQLKPVRGRMTLVSRGQPFDVLVDYAHSPTAFELIIPSLKKQLISARPDGQPESKLICLFGSAGERDTKKRGLQGAIAAAHSDIVILADEDPRSEEPMTILEEIAQACNNLTRDENLFLIPNRPMAMRKAFSLASPGDLVLLLGKGHENSIIYASGDMPYDEIGEAEAALSEMGYSG